ncbi:hypothetical protein Emag_002203 [Eimeria magna]
MTGCTYTVSYPAKQPPLLLLCVAELQGLDSKQVRFCVEEEQQQQQQQQQQQGGPQGASSCVGPTITVCGEGQGETKTARRLPEYEAAKLISLLTEKGIQVRGYSSSSNSNSSSSNSRSSNSSNDSSNSNSNSNSTSNNNSSSNSNSNSGSNGSNCSSTGSSNSSSSSSGSSSSRSIHALSFCARRSACMLLDVHLLLQLLPDKEGDRLFSSLLVLLGSSSSSSSSSSLGCLYTSEGISSSGLKMLNTYLGLRTFLLGHRLSLVDLGVYVHLRTIAGADKTGALPDQWSVSVSCS